MKLFLFACVFFEIVALAGMLAGYGASMRGFLVAVGGFWPDLLKGATPAFAGQPVFMFGTPAFLHGGPLHLFMNMVGRLWLGPLVVRRTRAAAFWPIAGVSALAAGGPHHAFVAFMILRSILLTELQMSSIKRVT